MRQSLLRYAIIFAVMAFLFGMLGAYVMNGWQEGTNNLSESPDALTQEQPSHSHNMNMPPGDGRHLTNLEDKDADPEQINAPFRKASAISRPSVVFLKVTFHNQRDLHGEWGRLWDFFGHRGPRTSTGSGVIIAEDGYIITNHHVLQNAEKIEVSLSDRRRTYEAEIVGSDPSTDLALVKINESNLPAISFSNSDEAHIGDWVLAVGNPFNLESTVTAGIISARSRHLDIVRGQFPLESFLQTDAAINPGNSGGALVNLRGELVGVNTAIVSRTGTYTGYGFAIPSNIVRKVATDLREHKKVQRAFLEADIVDIDREIARKLESDVRNGVYVNSVMRDGNAREAGLREGDVIVKVNGREVSGRAFFEEQLAYRRPGDEISITFLRGNEEREVDIVLKNRFGETDLLEERSIHSKALAAHFEEVSRMTKQQLGIDHGVRVFNIQQGILQRVGVPEGFIVTHFNREPYYSAEKLVEAMENAAGRFLIQGYRPDGSRAQYSFYAR